MARRRMEAILQGTERRKAGGLYCIVFYYIMIFEIRMARRRMEAILKGTERRKARKII